MNLKKLLDAILDKVFATNINGETSIHKLSILVLFYLMGLTTAIVPILNYFEISRPALISEVKEVDESSKKELVSLEIQLLLTKINTYEIELSMRNKDLAENRLSIKYVDENVNSLDERSRLLSAYSKETVLLTSIIEKLQHEIVEANKRIDKLKAR